MILAGEARLREGEAGLREGEGDGGGTGLV